MPEEKTNNTLIALNAKKRWIQFTETPHFSAQYLTHQASIVDVMGRSQFVADFILSKPELLSELLSNKWHETVDMAQLCEHITRVIAQVEDEETLLLTLRKFRSLHMAALAWRDLTQQQSIGASLQQTSQLADTFILAAYNWLYNATSQRYGIPEGPHGPQPLLMVGMGKLGGKELNFSSDIDLLFTYPQKGETSHPKKPIENQQFFTKLAQKLISALNKTTPLGQVFRVDMRLRPFGDSGPLVAHFAALEDYYQEQGRQWERYAMIKARVLNPASTYRNQLDAILTPFVYRRYLDFTTIDAIREMKDLISKELRRRRLAGNIKLGAGGIREIEFFAQSFQLIHGGKESSLQCKSLLATLKRLVDLQLIPAHIASQLTHDYFYLRKVEHTLQQFNDEQTQLLPVAEWPQHIVAEQMGEPDYQAFLSKIERVMARTHQQFEQLVAEPSEATPELDTLFTRCKDAWLVTMELSEFSELFSRDTDIDDTAKIFQHITQFKYTTTKQRIGMRGIETLNKLLPKILFAVLKGCPESASQLLPRLFSVVSAITGRTTYLDLLYENPAVLQQLIKLCARSEWITQQIRGFPLLLDELLTPFYLQQQQTDLTLVFDEYSDLLRQSLLRIEPQDTELLMEQWRQFKLSQQLRIAAADITGSLPIERVSDKLTVLAEVIIHAVFSAAWQQIVEKYGAPEHLCGEETGFLIIGYGKLGGFELGYGSDLDLVFIHNAPKGSETTGKKAVSAQTFYIKLAQRLMHLLNTKTMSGQLYETDLRLRPSGNAGLLCCHLNGFRHYQQNEAWTWEHQALVRTRTLCGDPSIVSEFTALRQEILQRKRNLPDLMADVVSMRQKMRDHLLNKKAQGIDLKQCEGGITDIEFMTQYWVLAYAHQYPDLTGWSDNLRILDAVKVAGLITEHQASTLKTAYLVLRGQYHELTLAEQKLAKSSHELEQTRKSVASEWRRLFAESTNNTNPQ